MMTDGVAGGVNVEGIETELVDMDRVVRNEAYPKPTMIATIAKARMNHSLKTFIVSPKNFKVLSGHGLRLIARVAQVEFALDQIQK